MGKINNLSNPDFNEKIFPRQPAAQNTKYYSLQFYTIYCFPSSIQPAPSISPMAARRRLSAVSAPLAAAATIAIIVAASSSTTMTSAFAPPPPSSSLPLLAGRNGIGRHRHRRDHRDATTTVPNRAAMVPEWLALDAATTTATASTAMTTTMAEHRQPASLLLEALSSPAATASALLSSSAPPSLASSSDLLLSFSDQGQNLAGTFFQLSLLPYLVFLYFLGFRGNRTPDLGKFGFAYLLLFVGGTIPSGIITKGAYGLNLANVDWIHGGAEALLTITNVLIVSIRKNNVRSDVLFF